MDLYSLYSAIRNGIAQDVELGAWAVSQFGQSISVFSGLPSDDFPDMDADTPFVALGDPEDERSQNLAEIKYALAGAVGLINDERRSDISIANITEPLGIQQIITAMGLIRAAIARNLPDGVTIDRFSTASDTLGAHNEVMGYFEASFRQTVLIGQDPLA